MEALIYGKERGRWNWDHNHCLGNKKIYPMPWPIDIRRVYRTLCEGIQLATFSLGKYAKQMKKREKQWDKTKR
jgi:hypothetical protein